eukprot:1987667-Prorocentrum_lima.AAC.1
MILMLFLPMHRMFRTAGSATRFSYIDYFLAIAVEYIRCSWMVNLSRRNMTFLVILRNTGRANSVP